MTDKEQIEVYVNKLPKSCEDCPCFGASFAEHYCVLCEINLDEVVGEKLGVDGKIRIPIFNYETLPSDCPLKTIQSVQNAKAVEVLKQIKDKIGKRHNEIRNRDILFWFKDGYSSCYYDVSDLIDQLIKEYGGKE